MRFRISKTQHQYGYRWSVLEIPPASAVFITREICRCPSMADASLVCQSLNRAVKDDETWKKMLGKASQAYSRLSARIVRGASSPARTARRGAGSAAQPADPRPAS